MSNQQEVSVINSNKYTCGDCKWNFLCNEGQRKNCSEFELDYIMSDKYIESVIESRRNEFFEQWKEYRCLMNE